MSFTVNKRIEIVQNAEGRFEEAVIAYLFIVNLLPIFIVPIMWYEAKKIASILNEWSNFEVCYEIMAAYILHKAYSISTYAVHMHIIGEDSDEMQFFFIHSWQRIYYKIAGKQLEVRLGRKALVISILLPLLSTLSVVVTHYVIRLDKTEMNFTFVLQVIPYCYLDT